MLGEYTLTSTIIWIVDNPHEVFRRIKIELSAIRASIYRNSINDFSFPTLHGSIMTESFGSERYRDGNDETSDHLVRTLGLMM